MKTHNRKKKPKDRRQNRKMKPYALTGDDRILLAFTKFADISHEDRPYRTSYRKVQKVREEVRTERKAEIHRVRQKSKNKIKKEIQDYKDEK